MAAIIQLYYFGALKRGFEQYPSHNTDLFKRHDRKTSNENWRFVASKQGDVCYYEYVVQGVRTALEGGRTGGRMGIALVIQGSCFTDPLKALDILKDIVKLLLKQGEVIKEIGGGELTFVPDSLSYKSAYLDDFSKGMADYMVSKHKDDLSYLTSKIPSITINSLATISPIDAANQEATSNIKELWKQQGAVGLTSYITSPKLPAPEPPKAYTKAQVTQLLEKKLNQERSNIRAEEKAKFKKQEQTRIEKVLAKIESNKKLVDKKSILEKLRADLFFQAPPPPPPNEEFTKEGNNVFWQPTAAFKQELQKGRSSIENISRKNFIDKASNYLHGRKNPFLKMDKQNIQRFLDKSFSQEDFQKLKECAKQEFPWPCILIACEEIIPPKPIIVFLEKYIFQIVLVLLLLIGGLITYKLWPEGPKPPPVSEPVKGSTDSTTNHNTNPAETTPEHNQIDSTVNQQTSLATPKISKATKVTDLCPNYNGNLLTLTTNKQGKARLYLNSRKFLTNHKGVAIANYKALDSLIWNSLEGCIQDKYGSREKMIQQVNAMNPTSFKSLEAFIKDQLDTAQTKTIITQASDNFVFAMQGHANLKTGKILKNPKGGGEILLYKEP